MAGSPILEIFVTMMGRSQPEAQPMTCIDQNGRNLPEKLVDSKFSARAGLAAFLAILCLSIAPTFGCSRSAARGNGAYIRVNQVGYEVGLPMRAYLMADPGRAGSEFSLQKSDGARVLSGAVGTSTGVWNNYTVYPLDFSAPSPGNYSLTLSGPIAAASPSFNVGTAKELYSVPLSNALQFYQNQRDGRDFIPSPLRTAASHLNDQHGSVFRSPEFSGSERVKGDLAPVGTVVDASGGWWDAGDYLKFVQTTSYVEALMLIGVRDFPREMGSGSTTSNFVNEARFGLDWLQRMWHDDTATLYYQVGIGSGISGSENDHSIWRLPEQDDNFGGTSSKYRYIRNRPVFMAGPPGSKISPNLAGRLAADFALGFMAYRESDPAYANRCLVIAEHIFDLADTAPRGELLTAAPHDFYGESEWRDDMELGATELYLATRGPNLPEGLPHREPGFYLKAAAEWASAYIHEEKDGGEILGLGNVGALSHFELYRAITSAENPGPLAVSPSDLLQGMKRNLDKATAIAGKDPFGFGTSWGGGDTPTHGTALAVMASQYDYLTESTTYDTYTRGWIANILGANAWGSSFIVGDGTTFPRCIHHQVANLLGSNDPPTPFLAGAVVEGPIEKPESGTPSGVKACPANGKDSFSQFDGNGAVYKDRVEFYATAEPAIDLTAPSFLIFAWRMAGEPSAAPNPPNHKRQMR
jgi:endoglucanase